MFTKRDEIKAISTVLTIGVLIFFAILLNLKLASFQFGRILFWLDVIFLPVSFLVSLISFIGAFVTRDSDRREWLIIGCVSLFFILVTALTIVPSYNQGYSEESIITKATLQDNLYAYNFISEIYTDEVRIEMQDVDSKEIGSSLCRYSNESCNKIINNYKKYEGLVGWKEDADKVARIWK